MRRTLLLVLAFTGTLSGCAYFNSLYNANRRFADARQAALAGDAAKAAAAYDDVIEKAAVSYRRYPDSRWADDALLLIGRSHFGLGDDARAAAALRTLLEQSDDAAVRHAAHAVLGAALVRAGDAAGGMVHLDSAAAGLPADTELGAAAHLWRARALFNTGQPAEAWPELALAGGHPRIAYDAALEGARRAVALRDSAQLAEHMQRLANTAVIGRSVRPVADLLTTASAQWSGRLAFAVSAPLREAQWQPAFVDSMSLMRARLAVSAGDTAAAQDIALRLANSAGTGVGSEARLLAARLRLRLASDVAELEEVRQLLLPAFDNTAALALKRAVGAVQILTQQGASPASALSLFAAAEMARDELGSPGVARQLFLRFADAESSAVWSGKALLAAHLIHPDAVTAEAISGDADNPYIRAAHGGSAAAAIDLAEQRLARGLSGIRQDALMLAVQRDVVAGRAIAVMDSARAAALSDSVRIACGTLVDTLGIAGIRADSTRAACTRGDSVRVAFVLAADTMLLRDSTAARTGSPPATLPRVRPDTLQLRPR